MPMIQKQKVLVDKYLRVIYLRENLEAFGYYYFGATFTHQSPSWHKDYCQKLEFKNKSITDLLMIGHRDSAKTTWAKIKIMHAICYRRKRYIAIVANEKDKAKQHLFDIALQLQTNKLLIRDFGQLFYGDDNFEKTKHSKQKGIENFVTENLVRCKAYSTAIPLRGEQYFSKDGGVFRPDLILLDDFETDKTKRSYVRTKEVITFLEDLKDVSSADVNKIYCCNRISQSGSVAYLENIAKANSHKWDKLEIKLIENSKITWPSKFVWTDKQALLHNYLEQDSKKWVKSVEQLKQDGMAKFLQEYQNEPTSEENEVIKASWIEDNVFYERPVGDYRVIVALDPQSGESKKADEFALTVLQMCQNSADYYVIEQIAGRESSLYQAALFIKTMQKYGRHALVGGVEVVLNQTAVYRNIIDWMKGLIELKKFGVNDTNKNINIVKTDPNGLKKGDRLMRQQARFERGEIHLRHDMLLLKQQLIYFQQIKDEYGVIHDDRADSLIIAIELANKNNWTDDKPNEYNQRETEDDKPISAVVNQKF